ncbi:Hypothetical predicted protein [Olea europaea subsp. europaea]|uniref:Uncharacterized protein n=1 Tax=Olea europaea subsp. europaea TaxID=158383 RepID=A0A8S0Q312_OLEEU|nr:Hypothetical predicted protein [Olea europaea subsp. europaea]
MVSLTSHLPGFYEEAIDGGGFRVATLALTSWFCNVLSLSLSPVFCYDVGVDFAAYFMVFYSIVVQVVLRHSGGHNEFVDFFGGGGFGGSGTHGGGGVVWVRFVVVGMKWEECL